MMEDIDDATPRQESLAQDEDQKKKKAQRKRKIAYAWAKKTEISALISAVQKRPALWDGGCSDYKLAHIKCECWKQVAEELGIQNVDSFEARNKWNALRSLFKANLGKIRAKKSGQGTSEIATVSWAHFSEMMFIESAEVLQSVESVSTLPLVSLYFLYKFNRKIYIHIFFKEGAYTDASILHELNQQFSSENVEENLLPAGKKQKSSSASPRTNSRKSGSMKDLAAEVLTNLQTRSQQNDRYTAFGELVERNLRALPVNDSLRFEAGLMRVMYDFLITRAEVITNPSGTAEPTMNLETSEDDGRGDDEACNSYQKTKKTRNRHISTTE